MAPTEGEQEFDRVVDEARQAEAAPTGEPGTETEESETSDAEGEPGPFNEDQAAKSAQASQPAPDGSEGS